MVINWTILLTNFIYAGFGAILTILFMFIGYKIFDRYTPFNTGAELQEGNDAVGRVIGGIFIGVGIAVGLVVGLGLN